MKKLLLTLLTLTITLIAESNIDINKLETECRDNAEPNSCHQAAMYYINLDNESGAEKGIFYLVRSCLNGGNRSCLLVGIISMQQEDYAGALTFFEMGCNNDDAANCEAYKKLQSQIKQN